jgi:DNA helicase II / ATP-dependent DNA helicase PcrA
LSFENLPVANFLEDLNEAQRLAVEAVDGPVMVIAGAGAGKTRVLTYRVAYLLNRGVDPFNILTLTFTNKAAREMKERIHQLVGGSDAHNVWTGTFHSVFARILRVEGHFLGYPSNFTIYDTDDSKRVIKSLIKEKNLDDKLYPPNYILHRISAAKTSLISAKEYNENPELTEYDISSGKPLTGELFLNYQSRLMKASAMDFDDLLFNMNILLRDFPEILYKYQHKFHYILVDEYQDTNYAQYLIIKQLAANDYNLCVVGDDAQSIYAFRGASIQNILNFKNDYPDHRLFKLEQNYRSTKTIVEAANKVIDNNKQQIAKEIWTDNEEGSKISLIHAATDTEEGNLVAQSIFESKMNQQLPNASFAILYRTNAQSRSIEEALRRLSIPCRIYGGLSFYQRKEIKDLLAYFRLVINPKDEDALLRVINYPARGIGKTTIEKLIVSGDKYKMSIFDILQEPDIYPFDLTDGTRGKLSAFITMIRSFAVLLNVKNAFELARHITTSVGILKELYEDKTPEGVSRFENIEELLNAIKEFTDSKSGSPEDQIPLPDTTEVADKQTAGEAPLRTLAQFMQDVSLMTDMDSDKDKNEDRVTLMTIHQAKGLEFPFIYIVGLEENLFPSIQSLNSRADLEEERRLFYVAITRAQKKLTLSYSETRYRWGNLTSGEPSRFINEIPEQYIDQLKRILKNPSFQSNDNFSTILKGSAPVNQTKRNLKPFHSLSGNPPPKNGSPGPEIEIETGMDVEHERFGKGKVISVEGNGPNKKATVLFPGIGQKQLLLRFAKLIIL